MIFGILTLLIALAIAGVAAWFSIVGLMAIFSASALSIAIMAGTLEIGKLIAASWLYRHWKETSILMKSYLTTAVLVLMLITSMGIFGYLSKAHLDQSAVGGNNQLQIQQIEMRIDREQRKITDANTVISQLDQTVQTLMDYDRIRGPEGALAVRESQAEERAKLNAIIDGATTAVLEYQTQLLPLREQQIQTELKVGPLKYVAELIYGQAESEAMLDKAVRLFIMLLVVVFDPLAIVMLLAANQTLIRHGITLEHQYEKAPVLDEIPFDGAPFDADVTTANTHIINNDLQDDLNNMMSIIAEKDRKIAELNSRQPEVIEREVIKEVPVEVEVIKEVVKEVEVKVPEIRYEKVPVEIEVPIETIKEVEKIVEVEVPVEIEKIVEKIVEKEVPVEVVKEVIKEVKVDNPELLKQLEEMQSSQEEVEKNHILEKRTLERKITRLSNQLAKNKLDTADTEKSDQQRIAELTAQLEQLSVERERFVEEQQLQAERDKDDLKKTAHVLANSEFNKEDLSEDEIYAMLKKSSAEDVKRKMGFWAVPLPNKSDLDDNK